MRLAAYASALVLTLTAAAYAGDPVGRYDVSGTNPDDNSTYKGTATVQKTGDTYSIIWVIDGQKYVGTAIGTADFFAVSYKSGKETGLGLYAPEGQNWAGIWTYLGGKKIAQEKWVRK